MILDQKDTRISTVRDQQASNMHAHPRSFGFNAVLTALIGLLIASGTAAATARVDCDHRMVRCSVTVNENLRASAKPAP
jgi:hypothetical protein